MPELDAKAGLPSSILKLSSERKTSKQDVRFFSPALAEELRFDKNAPSNDVQALKAALKQARSAKDLFASSLDLFREHLSATRAVEAESVEREEYPGTQMEDSNDPDELAPGNDTIAKEPTDPATGQISSIDTNTEAAPTTSSTQSTPGSRPDAAGANTEEVTEEACTRSHDHAIEQGGYQSQRFREALTHAKASRGNGPGEEVRAAARLAQLLALTDGLSEVLEVKQAGTAAMSLQLQATRDWANTKHGELVAALQQFDKAADDLNTIRISGHNAVMREQVKASMSGLNDCFDLIYKVYDWYEEKLSELAGLFAEHGLDMGTIEDDGMMGRLME